MIVYEGARFRGGYELPETFKKQGKKKLEIAKNRFRTEIGKLEVATGLEKYSDALEKMDWFPNLNPELLARALYIVTRTSEPLSPSAFNEYFEKMVKEKGYLSKNASDHIGEKLSLWRYAKHLERKLFHRR